MMNGPISSQILLSKKPELYYNKKEKQDFYDIVIRNYWDSGIYGFELVGKWLVEIKSIPNILTDFGPIHIEIVQKKNGTLLVYVPSYSADPIFQYDDPAPVEINYFSLRSYGSSSKWFYSCTFDNFGDESPASKNDICDCLNGFCATPGNCTCHPGFIPSNRNKTICEPFCIDGCPNGFCYSPGKCACNTGYFMNFNICEPVCKERYVNGNCTALEKIACDDGYYRTKNNMCKPICEKGCLNGHCIAPEKCDCDKGYYMMSSTNICTPVCRKGCLNGHCTAPGQCACNKGYYKKATNICEPVCKKGCANGYCSAPEKCSCSDGYKWSDNNKKCEPICKEGCLNGYCKYPGHCGCNEGYLWHANKCQIV